jgi:biopolymer transport protein ExbD
MVQEPGHGRGCLNKVPMSRQRVRPLKYIQKIELTAFVSVMVILVFTVMFLDFTSVGQHHGTGPTLPIVADPVAMPGALRADAVTITVRRDGRIYVGSDELADGQLVAALRRDFGSGAEQKAYIRVDARARYRDVKNVLDGVRVAGVENVGFLAEKRRPAVGPGN